MHRYLDVGETCEALLPIPIYWTVSPSTSTSDTDDAVVDDRGAIVGGARACRNSPGPVNVFDEGHGGVVAVPLAGSQDARVPAVPVRVPRGDLLEQLVDHVRASHDAGRLHAGPGRAALGVRDEAVGHLGQLPRLGQRRLNPPVLKQLRRHGTQHGPSVRRVLAELVDEHGGGTPTDWDRINPRRCTAPQ